MLSITIKINPTKTAILGVISDKLEWGERISKKSILEEVKRRYEGNGTTLDYRDVDPCEKTQAIYDKYFGNEKVNNY